MSSRSVARSVARSLRATGVVRAATAPRVLHVVNSPSLARSVAPSVGVALRNFSTTRSIFSKDTTWQTKGPMTYAELKPETESPSGEITIIDVREPNEVAQGIVPSAVNVPLSQFQKAFSGSGGDFVRDFAFQRPAYDDKVVFYCRSGKRSQQALEFAQKNGWWNTRNYEGSWLDWVQQEEARGQASKIKEDDD